nr:MAG TPA: hypothetical protein [Caudoviricetes sp.]
MDRISGNRTMINKLNYAFIKKRQLKKIRNEND